MATRIDPVFNNLSPGLVQVNTGILNLDSGGDSTGTFNTAAGTTLIFGGGTYTLDAGSTLTSSGLVQVTGGTLIVNATVSATDLGVLNGTLRITSNGMLNVAGNYDQQTSGGLVIEIGGTMPGAGYGQL